MDLLSIASQKEVLSDKLHSLTKEELIVKIEDLMNFMKKKDLVSEAKITSSKAKEKQFDFTKYKKRHVALKLLYLGWDYKGFAVQEYGDTIEDHLFNALQKTKLLEDRNSSNYHRCGRTDKGVSAFSQVISLDLRTNLLIGKGVVSPEGYRPGNVKECTQEIDYPAILNRVLPPQIRVIAWSAVEPDFSARFNCLQRTYKYWFPKGDLNIEKMLCASKLLVGEHDFRNFCKMDVGNGVVNYKRRICDIRISPVTPGEEGPYCICEMTVVGQAFLWHQIRCIIAVLFLIGQGKEDVEVVSQLLDVEKCPKKPQYSMASEIPLVLFDCSFEDIEWIYSHDCLHQLIKHLQNLWTQQTAKCVIIKRMLQELESKSESGDAVLNQAESLLTGVKSRVYKRLLERPGCETLEEKIAHFNKKRRTDALCVGSSENNLIRNNVENNNVNHMQNKT